MTKDAETYSGEIWAVPVRDILSMWNPFLAWTDDAVTIEEVHQALRDERLDSRPFDTIAAPSNEEENRRYHVERIAWLVVHHDEKPIEIDIGAPSLGWYPTRAPFDFMDGNHRLCAATYRGDYAILVSYGGECDIMPILFPNGWIHQHAIGE